MLKESEIPSVPTAFLPVDVTAANFNPEVLECRQPVLVEFWVPWSRPCQVLAPIVQELALDWAGEVKVAKINADDNIDLSVWYDIQSVPTLLYFKEGKVEVRIVGTATKDSILAKLKPSGTTDRPFVKESSAMGSPTTQGGLA